ncbi:hypothetical protein TNIN_464601 [Trichonephila inaurata madagascariensis]|uniref:Uncharacterized protein n=1 Tax=Trichonephila inaurata madagascariensis TaxID=2747483 RepID=A0A8X6YSE8_9ARAC|nr:hypothetical protein TNIN_464601 [Trichonephila inaurata madagascariensis]
MKPRFPGLRAPQRQAGQLSPPGLFKLPETAHAPPKGREESTNRSTPPAAAATPGPAAPAARDAGGIDHGAHAPWRAWASALSCQIAAAGLTPRIPRRRPLQAPACASAAGRHRSRQSRAWASLGQSAHGPGPMPAPVAPPSPRTARRSGFLLWTQKGTPGHLLLGGRWSSPGGPGVGLGKGRAILAGRRWAPDWPPMGPAPAAQRPRPFAADSPGGGAAPPGRSNTAPFFGPTAAMPLTKGRQGRPAAHRPPGLGRVFSGPGRGFASGRRPVGRMGLHGSHNRRPGLCGGRAAPSVGAPAALPAGSRGRHWRGPVAPVPAASPAGRVPGRPRGHGALPRPGHHGGVPRPTASRPPRPAHVAVALAARGAVCPTRWRGRPLAASARHRPAGGSYRWAPPGCSGSCGCAAGPPRRARDRPQVSASFRPPFGCARGWTARKEGPPPPPAPARGSRPAPATPKAPSPPATKKAAAWSLGGGSRARSKPSMAR